MNFMSFLLKKDDTGSLLKGVQNRKTSAVTIGNAHSWYELQFTICGGTYHYVTSISDVFLKLQTKGDQVVQ